MFLKLLKWDLKSQRKMFILFILYALSIVNIGITKVIGVDWLFGIAMALHTVLAVLLFAIPLVLLAINYNADLYGKNSYTMHQLAVKTSTILNAKLLAGAIYMLLAVVIFIVGTLAAITINGGYTTTAEVVAVFSEEISKFAELPNYIENISAFSFWLALIVFSAFTLFSMQIFYSFVISFGNCKLLRRFGRIGILLSFLAVYLGSQVMTFITTLYIPLSVVIERVTFRTVKLTLSARPFTSLIDNHQFDFVSAIPLGSLLISALLTALGYIYVVHALDHKKSIG